VKKKTSGYIELFNQDEEAPKALTAPKEYIVHAKN
jgi:hypothetical protein